jgi:Cys-tRNA(Pro)/Cys-tRNA(Cys) deacylase
MAKTARPPGARILDQRGIAYELIAFDDAIRSADGVARASGLPLHLVYKTLVVETVPPGKKPYLVMVPADTEIDLKALARATGDKRVAMASHRDAERHTGLKVGGISAIPLAGRGFPVLIDERALDEEHILVSAGQRGYDVRIAVRDLLAITGATPVSLLP